MSIRRSSTPQGLRTVDQLTGGVPASFLLFLLLLFLLLSSLVWPLFVEGRFSSPSGLIVCRKLIPSGAAWARSQAGTINQHSLVTGLAAGKETCETKSVHQDQHLGRHENPFFSIWELKKSLFHNSYFFDYEKGQLWARSPYEENAEINYNKI